MTLQGMLRFKMGWAKPEGPYHDVVLASRVRLARNLSETLFPGRAQAASLRRGREAIFAAAKKTYLKNAAYFLLDELDGEDRGFLAERHLISPALAEDPGPSGVVISPQECLNLMVNEEDHLRLYALAPGLNLKQAWREADGLDDELSRELPFAFHKEWGYLTTCPTNVGTGLRASCLIHLPGLGLANLINKLLESLPRAGLIARGLYGEGTKVIGDFFQISNATALGRTEEELVQAVERAVEELARREKEARVKLAAGAGRTKLEDSVHRALGTLSNARLLSFEEACHHLSALRLGLSLGWDMRTELETVNELLILIGPAHLDMLAGKPLSDGDRAMLRASLVRRRLAGK